jgi:hypothetical protein
LRDNPRMANFSASRRGLAPLAIGVLSVALTPWPSAAADLAVTARESIVRSAPFEVAPEVGRVHSGERLPADDQPQGAWRRVQLPNGHRGFLREADVKIITPPAPQPAPAAATGAAAANAAATGAAPTNAAAAGAAAAGPQKIALRVTVLELGVRATAAADAPILKTLHQDDEVLAFADPRDGWRRIEISADQIGFVSDAGVQVVEAPAGSTAQVTAAMSVATPPPATADQATAESPSELTLLGVLFEILPTGRLNASETGTSPLDNDTAFSVAVAPFLDVSLSPYVALGFSPQFIFGVQGKGASQSATEYDLRARLTARYPVSPNARVYARFSPGYSIVSLREDLPSGVSDPAGLLLDFAVGTEIAVLPKLFLVVDLGYQVGFQSTSDVDGSNVDFTTSYLHLGAGLAIGF